MKLGRITILRMPGIDRQFTLDRFSDEVNLIIGPNGSGKTSLCRAVRAALWPEAIATEPVTVEMEWAEDDDRLSVRRQGGRCRWQRNGASDEAPALPSHSISHCFTLGLRDLLMEESPTNKELVQEVMRQLSGGYDVAAVAEQIFVMRPYSARKAVEKLAGAHKRVQEIKGKQRGLADRQAQLLDRKDDLDRARAAEQELGSLKKAREFSSARVQLEELEQKLGGLPEGMERIRGNELTHLENAENLAAEHREELQNCKLARLEAEKAIADNKFTDGPVDEVLLDTWFKRANQMLGIESDIARAQRRVLEADERLAACTEQLGVEPGSEKGIRIDRETLRNVDAFLRRSTAVHRRRAELEAERALLDGGNEEISSRRLEQVMEALLGWLAAPGKAGAGRLVGSVLAGSTVVVAGIAQGLQLHWTGWLVAMAGVAILAFGLWPRRGAGVADASFYKDSYEKLGVAPPTSWDRTGVEERLQSIRGEWARLALHEERRSQRDALDRKMRKLEREELELQHEREQLRSSCGLDPEGADLDLAFFSRLLFDWRESDTEARAARSALVKAKADLAAGLTEVSQFLGESDHPGGVDAVEAISRLEELRDRNARLLAAKRNLTQAASTEEILNRKIKDLENSCAEIYGGAGLTPGDRQGLEKRIEELPRYKQIHNDKLSRRAIMENASVELAGRKDLMELPPEEIDAMIRNAKESSARIDDINREIGSIEQEVRQAQAGDELERLMAELQEAEDELTESRQETMRRAAGRFLLQNVSRAYERESQPEVLRHARKLFAEFTHGRYDLILDQRAASPAFRAKETSTGDGKSLPQLSDATRIQLLLAVRMAFASHADRGAVLPLFLDEVLTTSDPMRFRAIAESLIFVAGEEGRQIFYLTSNPGDAGWFNGLLEERGQQPAPVIDLAEERSLQAAVSSEDLAIPPKPSVPSIEGRTAEEYGAALKVPAVDPNREHVELHIFHLLRDDLPLLRRLLVVGIENVGIWRQRVAMGAVSGTVGNTEEAGITALADLARAFVEYWRIGRGRQLDGEALRASGCVSDAYLEKMTSLAREYYGNSRLFMNALEKRNDDRAKGFRVKNEEALLEYLLREGYLDEREILAEQELLARVLAAVANHLEAGCLSPEAVALHVHRLYEQA